MRCNYADLKVAKDDKRIPRWDLKIQREHEAKNPGPPRKDLKRERGVIVISDDDGAEDEEQATGEPCALDLWDDLVMNRPDQ